MSFTADIKSELISIYPKSACCRKAIAAGLEFCSVKNGNERELSIACENDGIKDFVSRLIKEKYKTDAKCECKSQRGRLTYKFYFSVDSEKYKYSDVKELFKCASCAAAFIRGVFIAMGSVSDPSSCYHAELVLSDAMQAKTVFLLLSQMECQPKIIDRPKGVGLYYKKSEAIEALLVIVGANNSAFHMMNCKIEREIRNSENRATNCVAKNISKSVETARRQVSEIELLMQSGRFEALPPDIQQTARLRLEHRDVSLAELASLHVPAISKSGLNHRLAKISEEAQKIIIK